MDSFLFLVALVAAAVLLGLEYHYLLNSLLAPIYAALQ